MEPLSCLISVLLGLATNELSEQTNARRREKLDRALADRDLRARALASFAHLDNELRRACRTLFSHRNEFPIAPEQPRWALLQNHRKRALHEALLPLRDRWPFLHDIESRKPGEAQE